MGLRVYRVIHYFIALTILAISIVMVAAVTGAL